MPVECWWLFPTLLLIYLFIWVFKGLNISSLRFCGCFQNVKSWETFVRVTGRAALLSCSKRWRISRCAGEMRLWSFTLHCKAKDRHMWRKPDRSVIWTRTRCEAVWTRLIWSFWPASNYKMMTSLTAAGEWPHVWAFTEDSKVQNEDFSDKVYKSLDSPSFHFDNINRTLL